MNLALYYRINLDFVNDLSLQKDDIFFEINRLSFITESLDIIKFPIKIKMSSLQLKMITNHQQTQYR